MIKKEDLFNDSNFLLIAKIKKTKRKASFARHFVLFKEISSDEKKKIYIFFCK